MGAISNTSSTFLCRGYTSSYGFGWSQWKIASIMGKRKLGEKGDIGFFIGYSADSCAYRGVYKSKDKDKENHGDNDVTFDFDLTILPAPRSVPDAQAPQVLQTPTVITTTSDTAPTPTNSSSQATNFLNTSQDVDELETQQLVQHQPATIAYNVSNAMFDDNTFVNPFATLSTSVAESSSSQYVDPSNMHTFYQPYPHEYQWTKDHPLEQVIGELLRPVLTRNQLRSDGDMCMYALTVSTMGTEKMSNEADDRPFHGLN
ncbi:hypothetical protein Tco_0734626 [Tanacetum coccineum]